MSRLTIDAVEMRTLAICRARAVLRPETCVRARAGMAGWRCQGLGCPPAAVSDTCLSSATAAASFRRSAGRVPCSARRLLRFGDSGEDVFAVEDFCARL